MNDCVFITKNMIEGYLLHPKMNPPPFIATEALVYALQLAHYTNKEKH